jgi:hypothetical protein
VLDVIGASAAEIVLKFRGHGPASLGELYCQGCIQERLPFWTRGQDVTVGRVALIGPGEKNSRQTEVSTRSWATGVRLRAGKTEIAVEESSQKLEFGKNTTVLLNTTPFAESVEIVWELTVEPKVVNEEFFRSGDDIQILIKYATTFVSAE